MIKHLYIKDFILIEELDLDFNNGFSAFTGETGAGKSILIDAIGYLSGDRANSAVVRKGCSKAILEGVFDVSASSECKNLLEELDFDVDEEIIISRVINSDGKSNIKLNHRTITLSLLKQIFALVIDIHSQHNTQYLLKKNYHITLLDKYCNNKELLNEVKNLYLKYDNLTKEYNDALLNTYNENDLEYLNYQVEEIENAQLQIGEDEELEQQEKDIREFEKSFTSVNQVLELLNSDEGINNQLYEAINNLNAMESDKLNELNERINNSYQDLIDVSEELSDYSSSFDFDEETINEIQNRLFDINKMKRKYGNSIELILDKQKEMLKQIDMINNRQEYLDDMEVKISKVLKKYNKKAAELTVLRQEKAVKLEKDILNQLKDLELQNAEFKVTFENCEPSSKGNEKVEFLISMNKGMNLQPLSKVASGGELSRLMLGLKVIFTGLTEIDTIIFDEIDSGVSGKVASSIGIKMATLAKNVQVFAVTHLSQVASCANMHYHIDKNNNNSITTSVCKLLNEEERIEKLADISYGKVSKSALVSSKELFDDNQAKVKQL